MIKLKTHFEQVPLEIVKKIVEPDTVQENGAVLPTTARKKKPKTNPREAMVAGDE